MLIMKNIKKRSLIIETLNLIDKKVKLFGWVDSKRDHGQVTFVDLRDMSAIVQCVGYKMMKDVTTESVIEVIGKVVKRDKKSINKQQTTGEVEIQVESYHILNKAKEMPITMTGDGKDINEEARLKYRYLDLRRERMQNNVRLRSQLYEQFRHYLNSQDFVEIETPLLTKSTKEGARDFLVPSRFQPGKFYALPQSPQQYKQLLMTAGFERYYQFARCIRDEDLRADRGFEFTQLDIEMSFIDQISFMKLIEDMTKHAVTNVGGKLKSEKFPIFNYEDAMQKFGADKFDLRTKTDKQKGVLAFAWVINFPFFKKVDQKDKAEVADSKSGWTFTHNPFSSPIPEHVKQHLEMKNIDQIVTAQYDLVCNGYEVGGGSIRAHDPEVLKSTFKIMGYSEAEIQESVGHMLKAFELGTPPHGGIAFGMDRLVMLLSQEESLREVVAFPMTSTGRTAVMDAPNTVSAEHLDELGLEIKDSQEHPHDLIMNQLHQNKVDYKYYTHEPVFSSKQAAKVRGTNIKQSAKALVLVVDKSYILFVLPGDKRADLKSLKKLLKAKKVVMASKESVKSKTGLEVGAIPPFGSVLGLPTYIDKQLETVDTIAFNVAYHDRSVSMSLKDFIRIENPEILDLA